MKRKYNTKSKDYTDKELLSRITKLSLKNNKKINHETELINAINNLTLKPPRKLPNTFYIKRMEEQENKEFHPKFGIMSNLSKFFVNDDD